MRIKELFKLLKLFFKQTGIEYKKYKNTIY